MNKFLLLLFAPAAFTLASSNASTNNVNPNEWGVVTNNAQMSIVLEDGSQAVKTNQPVALRIRVKNVSSNETFYVVETGIMKMDPNFSLRIISPTGKDVSPPAEKTYISPAGSHPVAPRQTRESHFNLSELFEFKEVGIYTITAKKELWPPDGSKTFTVVSEPLSLSVVPGVWNGIRTNRAPIHW